MRLLRLVILFYFIGQFQVVKGQTTSIPSVAISDGSNAGTGVWTSLTNVYTCNTVNASATITGSSKTQYLKASGFNFSIPVSDVIDGIVVKVTWSASNTGVTEETVSLVKGGSVQGINKSTVATLNTVLTLSSYGATNDLWGLTLTPADLNSSNFGVVLSAQRTGGGSRTVNVDCISITVYHHTPVPFYYDNNSTCFNTTNTSVNPNTSNNKILGIKIITHGEVSPFNLTSLNFDINGGNGTGSDNPSSNILNAKVYSTGNSSVFSITNQFGSTINSPTGTFSVNGSAKMLADTNYFWLSYDLTPGAIINDRIDAQCTQFTFDGGIGVKTPLISAPMGFRTIANPHVYTVGSSGRNYTTLQAAYNAIPSNPSNTYILELYNDYNSSLETFPISLTDKLNQSNIIIRPAAAQSNIIIQGSIASQGVINIDGGRNLIIDGYAGGIGTTKDLMIRNTKNASPYGVSVFIKNDAQSITIQNLKLEAETIGGSGIDGIISIGTTTGSLGNDNITIDNCFLNDLTVGGTTIIPYAGIYSGGTAGKTNDYINVVNCISPVCAPAINVLSNTNYVTVKYNHFYLPASFPAGTGNFQFVNISGGISHIVSNNYLGGTALSTGGAMPTISGSGLFSVINVSSSGSNVIQNNKINNFNYTTTYSGAMQPLVFFRLAGDGDFIISDNIVGSVSGTDSLVLTHNGTGGAGITFLYETVTGKTEILNNLFGAITQSGTFAAAVMGFTDLNNGINVVKYNMFGNSSSNNIKINTNTELVGVYGNSSAGLVVENNMFQNILHNNTGTKGMKMIHNIDGTLNCKGNSISNLTFNGQLEVRMISHIANSFSAYIKNNSISGLTLNNPSSTGAFSGIYLNNNVIAYVDSNLIGSKVVNNITLKHNGNSYGLNYTGTGTVYSTGNTIQQFNHTNSGTASCFKGVFVQGGLLYSLYDTVSNINYAGSYTADGIVGFEIDLGATDGSEIKKAYITNIKGINTTGVDLGIDGIDIYAQTNIEDCFISGIENKATGAATAITGIYTESGANIYNNVILLNNGSNTNSVDVYGIETNHSIGDVMMYHNTIKIYGSQTGGTLGSYGFFRWTSSNTDLRNNILQNIRLGGTFGHYAIFMNNTAGIYVDDYNYVQTENTATLAYWGSDLNFSGYQSAASALNSINGAITIDSQGFTSGVIEDAGTDLTSIVSKDRLNTARDVTPWIGAYEIAGFITRYWVGGSGNWNSTSKWSTTSGGAPGASVPTAINDVYFDSNSNSVSGPYDVVIPAGNWNCKNIYFNDITKSPVMKGDGSLIVLQ